MANSAFGRAAFKAVGMPDRRKCTVFHHLTKRRRHLHGVASAVGYPGSARAYGTLMEMTDADLLAKAAVWAAETDRCDVSSFMSEV
jgi:hypothetical protein